MLLKRKLEEALGNRRYFKLIEETENTIEIPRGFIGKLIQFYKTQILIMILTKKET